MARFYLIYWRFVFTIITSLMFWCNESHGFDSTQLFNLAMAKKKGMKQCCTTTIEQKNWELIDCYSGSRWNCPYPGYGNAGSYSGQFPCKNGYVLMNISTYEKWNWYYGRYEQMVRAAWCAPVKYECHWIPSEKACNN